jgi:predicted phage replisome organizer
MAEVKWIKITTDMFDNRKIKHLRRLPDGNNIVLIWVMLLTMAGRCNSGGMIFLTENIPYTPKMLADELDFEENTVILALQVLEQLNMIVVNNGFFAVAGWEEYQSTDRLAEIREYNRIAKQKSRAKQKQLQDVNDKSMTSQRCHDTDIDKEEDKDIKNKNKKKKSSSSDFDSILSEISDDSLRDLYIEFINMRKKIKSPIASERALRMLINKVNELEPNDIGKQKKMLENAIVNNWKSVYPLKEEKKVETPKASYNLDRFEERSLNSELKYERKKK